VTQITRTTCNQCGAIKDSAVYTEPKGWLRVSIVQTGASDNDLNAHACSKDCAAILLRAHTAGWISRALVQGEGRSR
jgi:hypothetical protein